MGLLFGLVCILIVVHSLDAKSCSSKSDCKVDEICGTDGECKSMCSLVEDSCSANAHCLINDGRASCFCKDGFSGNPLKSKCERDRDCNGDADCANKRERDRKCALIEHSCGEHAHCGVEQGVASCFCDERYIGTPPKIKCTKIPGCEENAHCELGQVCEDRQCVPFTRCNDLCRGRCGNNTECSVYRNAAICRCVEERMIGTPYIPKEGCRSFPGNCQDEKGDWTCKKRFYFHHTEVTWQVAHSHCFTDGKVLASIKSVDEQTDLQNAFLSQNVYTTNGFWLGGIAIYEKAKYRWIDAGLQHLQYFHWEHHQPNYDVTAKDCIFANSRNLKWHNEDCKKRFGYVCEGYEEKMRERKVE